MLRKILIVVVSILAGFLLLLLLIAKVFEGDIEKHAKKYFEENLDCKVHMEDIRLSLIKNFPNASVSFEDILLLGKAPFGKDTFVYARNLSVVFSITDLLGDEYSLNKVIAEDGTVNILYDKSGKNNFDIIKNSGKGNSNFHLEINRFDFKNLQLNVKDAASDLQLACMMNSGDLKGNFSHEKYVTEFHSSLTNLTLAYEEVSYIDNKTAVTILSLEVDRKKNQYIFTNSKVNISDVALMLNGTIVSTSKRNIYDLKFESGNASVQSVLSLLPASVLEDKDAYRYKGTASLTATVKTVAGKTLQPSLNVQFETSNAAITERNSGYSLENISMKGTVGNRSGAGFLDLKNIHAMLEGQPLQGHLYLDNFKKPFINVELDATLDIKKLLSFYKPDTIEEASGFLDVKAFFSGKIGEKATYRSSGTCKMTDLLFRFKQDSKKYHVQSGSLFMHGNEVTVSDVILKTPKSDFTISGTCINLVPRILNLDSTLSFEASFQSSFTDAEEVLGMDNQSNKSDSSALSFDPNLSFEINLKSAKVVFRKFVSENLTGIISLKKQVLSTKNFHFNTVNGEVAMQGVIDASEKNKVMIHYHANVKQLNIRQLFYEMGNFGQNVLQDKNLDGSVTADVQFSSEWTPQMDIITDKVRASSDLVIKDGRLYNFEPMLALSRYVKGTDLKNVQFSTLRNNIRISDRKIFIPEMEIHSTALNITISGTHTFDNMIDYKIKMLLADFLGKKVKEKNTEFGVIEDDGSGRALLHLSMTGPLDNPKFKYDRKAVQDKIAGDINKEKKTVKDILNKEFGWFKKDSIPQKKEKKQEELQIDVE